MKHFKLSILFLLTCVFSYSQIKFEKGYFIDNNNQRIECYIKNQDWVKNPTKFEYKTSLIEDETSTATIDSIKEFSITDFSKYIRFDVDIDKSKELNNWRLSDLSDSQEPVWVKERLFLKILVQGKANLYYFEDSEIMRFFYNVNPNLVEQLVYKEYSVDGQTLKINRYFQQQLLTNLKCANTNNIILEKMSYKINELVNYFTKYNECFNLSDNPKKVNINSQPKKISRVKIVSGYTSSDFFTTGIFTANANSSSSKTNFKIGAEIEFILPFNRNKWSLTVNPNYENFITNSSSNYSGAVEIKSSALELAAGARHYFYFNNQVSLFANIFFCKSLFNNSDIKVGAFNQSRIASDIHLAGGIGLKMRKISAEIRVMPLGDIQYTNLTYTQRKNLLTFFLAYTLFESK